MDFTTVAQRIIAKALKRTDDRNAVSDRGIIALLNYSLVDPELIVVYTNEPSGCDGFLGHRLYYRGKIFAGVTSKPVYDL